MENKIRLIFSLIPFFGLAQQLELQTHTMEYDDLNRLTQVVFSNGDAYEYSYDNLGNRITRNVSEVQRTYVPDDAFEMKLIDEGYDDVMDDYVITSNISGITFLFASDLGIQDATGIEDFSSIETLYFNNNNISQIDISQNTQLDFFQISGNNLTSLDVSSNLLLESLDVSDNNLSQLDISNNTLMFFLTCSNNQISELDLTNNLNLGLLNAHFNQIENIDLSQNTNLSYIWIRNNPIEVLDLSNNPNLDEVNAENCPNLYFINVKNNNNSILTQFESENCPNLFCIQVDDENGANSGSGVYGGWEVDPQVEYSEDCGYLGLNDSQNAFDFYIHPNPTDGELIISFNLTPSIINPLISVIDMQGRLVKKEQAKVKDQIISISISNLENGIYLINISEKNISSSQLIIKK